MDFTRRTDRTRPLYPPSKIGSGLRHPLSAHAINGTYCKRGCKVPWDYVPGDDHRTPLYERNTSCMHVVATLLGAMRRMGWTVEDAQFIALDSDTFKGFNWLRAQEEPQEVLQRLWDESYTLAEVRKYRADNRRADSAKTKDKPKPQLKFRYSIWCDLLDWLEQNPGSGMREAKKSVPYGGGLVQDYITEGKRRGYIEDRGKRSQNGKLLKSELHAVAWPEEPRITRPKWNQPKVQQQYWERVHAVPELTKMSDAKLVELYDSGMLDKLIEAWERRQDTEPVQDVETRSEAVESTEDVLDAVEPVESVQDVETRSEADNVLPFKMASSGPLRIEDNGGEELSQLLQMADELAKSKSAILSA